jgi:iron complex transport system substrate-binding protein
MNIDLKACFVAWIVLATSSLAWGAASDSQNDEGFSLGIYGNANMDDTVDEQDIEYLKGVIAGISPATNLSDANYDGKIDEDDITQVDLIIRGEEKKLTLVDSANRTVTIEMPVEAIAALHTSPCREFCMLEAKDRVVGVTEYLFDDPDMYPGLGEKANIGSSATPNYEKIAEIRPDVLICQLSKQYLDPVIAACEPIGIDVVSLDLRPPQGGRAQELKYDLELRMLGYILGKVDRANAFIKWRQDIMHLAEERTSELADQDRVRVLCLDFTSVASGNTEFYYGWGQRFINLSGGRNIAGSLPSSGKISGEWILEEDPDVIILASCYPSEGFGYSLANYTLANESLSVVLKNSILGQTNAAKNGNVFLYSYYGLGSGGQTQLGALYLAKRIYPELFEDIDPVQFHREYFEEWFGIPYQGVWFYP